MRWLRKSLVASMLAFSSFFPFQNAKADDLETTVQQVEDEFDENPGIEEDFSVEEPQRYTGLRKTTYPLIMRMGKTIGKETEVDVVTGMGIKAKSVFLGVYPKGYDSRKIPIGKKLSTPNFILYTPVNIAQTHVFLMRPKTVSVSETKTTLHLIGRQGIGNWEISPHESDNLSLQISSDLLRYLSSFINKIPLGKVAIQRIQSQMEKGVQSEVENELQRDLLEVLTPIPVLPSNFSFGEIETAYEVEVALSGSAKKSSSIILFGNLGFGDLEDGTSNRISSGFGRIKLIREFKLFEKETLEEKLVQDYGLGYFGFLQEELPNGFSLVSNSEVKKVGAIQISENPGRIIAKKEKAVDYKYGADFLEIGYYGRNGNAPAAFGYLLLQTRTGGNPDRNYRLIADLNFNYLVSLGVMARDEYVVIPFTYQHSKVTDQEAKKFIDSIPKWMSRLGLTFRIKTPIFKSVDDVSLLETIVLPERIIESQQEGVVYFKNALARDKRTWHPEELGIKGISESVSSIRTNDANPDMVVVLNGLSQNFEESQISSSGITSSESTGTFYRVDSNGEEMLGKFTSFPETGAKAITGSYFILADDLSRKALNNKGIVEWALVEPSRGYTRSAFLEFQPTDKPGIHALRVPANAQNYPLLRNPLRGEKTLPELKIKRIDSASEGIGFNKEK